MGRQFDEHGNLKDWWLPETKLKFLNKTKCIIDQYGNFTVPNLKMNVSLVELSCLKISQCDPISIFQVNGKTTQGENIADNGGMKSAYYAYTKWVERNNAEPLLPGLQQYTAKQMFWISAAQTWCSANRDWYTKMTMTVDTHAPSKFRVIGSVKNNDDFASDFKCAAGTPMNPVEKCKIW